MYRVIGQGQYVQTLHQTDWGEANGITVVNDIVYTSGVFNGKACYWTGKTRTDLTIPNN